MQSLVELPTLFLKNAQFMQTLHSLEFKSENAEFNMNLSIMTLMLIKSRQLLRLRVLIVASISQPQKALSSRRKNISKTWVS